MALDNEPSIKYPSQAPPLSDGKNPHVMIVGAGLAGLLLGILLDKAGIPYDIYERAKEVKPLGAVMSLNAGVFPVLEQLGLYDELMKLSLPATGGLSIYNGDLTRVTSLKSNVAQYIGYPHIVFPRPEFYNLLLNRVPREKIHFSKKVMSLEQNKEGVMIRCADGTTYHGDILVGADGAYSGVRQSLYKRLEKHGKLPLSDGSELNKGFICMVGTTDPLDPAKYLGLDSETANINQIIGKNNLYSWSAFSVPGNRICWNAILQLSTVKEASEHKFKNSEWGPETSEPMIKEVRDFLIPFGGTLGDLIDATPRDNISRVFLEDKLFETWHYGRTVLVGDGLSPLDVKEAFEMYKEERYSKVKDQFSASKTNAKLIYGHKFIDQVMRYVAFNFIPQKMLDKGAYKGMDFRPQAIFLPQVPNRGTTPVLPQRVSKRYQEEQAKLGKNVANKKKEGAGAAVV
ncbi:hypothetical protein EC957_009601 [Mortierella hygrophila]|uniref:FAD-binding domain-containing protein n=1 Tax=Mortierella hygrophila TaxID=979708 RepID=A0A9P6EWG6_9FUNG|nr:hypothetical protein EC957_009601 [Mortierella hygrophila]